MQNVDLVCAWKLLSIFIRTPNEDTTYPWGENPFEGLKYDNKRKARL